ncbi:flagellar biosynthetic protein FlhB [Buchnera aphidicola str. Bp (Baizongia pistaciae)]|uniref:Flagellar biosynthetic protein FlhB n=1 Tax=Buchnera aphidicola subsp. Baizongia pistaciae (strain Bp) TaxID=224915 RepID=FLHB_BUCBP|nr:EscU/YscU/HrcU family type III secretion system export apparatus switch protein [Buchnera aphidicola]Q89AN6.1 RecName: Full=Flagellar biosynthetic protein FlhB [Buchnera aphidicola str. Bp (Baizongia pistaciae)]AAO26953.1 flagellar biosynthetic protein FlhB [Buchnera aphidicola str. Bp (Baizongia pistaciae)]
MNHDESEEKTESPTSYRLKISKETGHNRYYRELYSLLILTITLINFWYNQRLILTLLKRIFYLSFTFNNSIFQNDLFLDHNFLMIFQDNLISLLGIIFFPMLIFMFPAMILCCSNFNFKFIKFDINKLNPILGFKNVFSIKSIVDLFKTVLKIVFVSIVVYLFISKYFLKVCFSSNFTFDYILNYSVRTIFLCFLTILIFFIPIIIIDLFWEKYNFYRSLRMTRKEVSDELKNMEGNPRIKSRIRQIMFSISNRRMLSNVSKSDVIVVNPMHYAIAIKYNETNMYAPKILAKGIDELAIKIKKIGNNHSIPTLVSHSLAHVLYYRTEVGEYIPSVLYEAVAEVLAWVWKIRHWKIKGGVFPRTPEKFFIPSELYEKRIKKRG